MRTVLDYFFVHLLNENVCNTIFLNIGSRDISNKEHFFKKMIKHG